MNYSFHEACYEEFFDIVGYYEEHQSGLGLRFAEEIYATIDRICNHPHFWTRVDFKTRRCLTKGFPYGVLYRIVENHIQIMAIMHLHRKPDYWKNRS
jgi:plasmid stabilization system protein ParE